MRAVVVIRVGGLRLRMLADHHMMALLALAVLRKQASSVVLRTSLQLLQVTVTVCFAVSGRALNVGIGSFLLGVITQAS